MSHCPARMSRMAAHTHRKLFAGFPYQVVHVPVLSRTVSVDDLRKHVRLSKVAARANRRMVSEYGTFRFAVASLAAPRDPRCAGQRAVLS